MSERKHPGGGRPALRRSPAWILVAALIGAACHPPAPASPATVEHFEGANLFTCCNLHYGSDHQVSDANYWEGETLPAGTPVHVVAMTGASVTFIGAGTKLTLTHEYGTSEETSREYFDKIFVPTDPSRRIASYPKDVRQAIERAKVERGMTRDQVIASLGYPPTHETSSLRDREWTYWYDRWQSYKVVFNDAGKVAKIVGRPAPTAELPIGH